MKFAMITSIAISLIVLGIVSIGSASFSGEPILYPSGALMIVWGCVMLWFKIGNR